MRSSPAAHHAQFQQAFIAWRWPQAAGQAAPPLKIAQALQRWLAELPEDAETVQRLAVGAAAACLVAREWEATHRVAQAGLNATLVGALSSEERLVSATSLALLGGRAAFALNNAIESRALLGRARETAQLLDAFGPLAPYLQM